jgi:hypothetical protein
MLQDCPKDIPMDRMKVFCLGLGKTGTTSLGQFLLEAGLKHYSNYHDTERFFHNDIGYFDKLIEQYDSFDDFPWPLMAERLAGRTDSLFVLTFRASFDEWYKSLCSHYERYGPSKIDMAVYGWFKPHGREAYYRHYYESHNTRIRALFHGRSDFLELNPADASMWEPLYERLNVDRKAVIIKHEHRDARTALQKGFHRDAAAKGPTYAIDRLTSVARTASNEDYLAARMGVSDLANREIRRVDLQRETGQYDKQWGYSEFDFAPYSKKTSSAATIVMTIVKNEPYFLPRWIDHYSRQFANRQLLVFDDNSREDVTAICARHSHVLRLPLPKDLPFYDRQRGFMISQLMSGLNAIYAQCVYTDVDELLVADSRVAATVGDYLEGCPGNSLAALGVEIIHHTDAEAPLTLQSPLHGNRRYGWFSHDYSKPVVQRGPVSFSPGFHFTEIMPALTPDLYLLHLRFVDHDQFQSRSAGRAGTVREASQVHEKAGEHWLDNYKGPFNELNAAVRQNKIIDWTKARQEIHTVLMQRNQVAQFGIHTGFVEIDDHILLGS